MNEMVRFLVQYGPTILFSLILLISIGLGALRGYHKSKVMFFHSLIIGGTLLLIYIFIINNPSIDKYIVEMFNTIMGDGWLQTKFNVSMSCHTLTDILIEYLPTKMSYGDAIYIIFQDNGVYLSALVNLAYHLIFFVLFFIVYLIIKLIVTLIYYLTYSENRYHSKVDAKFMNYETDRGYKIRRGKGATLGLARGLISSLLIFSILGGSLYAVTGGLGHNDLDGITLGDDEYDKYLDLYKEIDSYGQKGIFKVLNTVKDNKDVPVYLYIADLIFRGGYEGKEESSNIVLRDEIANLTSFSKDSIKLMIKYGGDDIKNVMTGKISESEDKMDIICNTMSNTEFQLEFYQLFNKLDSDSYAVNFSLGLVDSMLANIDMFQQETSDNEGYIELMKVLFKKGYKSNLIPFENKMIIKGDNTELPYIKPSKLIRKNDVNILLHIILDSINSEMNSDDRFENLFYNIRQLSILNTYRKEELNPVFARFFAFIDSYYLSEVAPDEDIQELSNEDIKEYHDFIYYTDVDWVAEINGLFDQWSGIKQLKNNLVTGEDDLSKFFMLFDENDPNYDQNYKIYNKLKGYIFDSKLVGKLLSSTYLTSKIEKFMVTIMPNMYFNKDIVYENSYDKNGNLTKRGELSNALSFLEFFAKNENRDLFNNLFNGENIDINLLKEFKDKLDNKDENGISYCEYLTDSNLIRSLVSSAIIEYGSEYVYIPNESKERDKDNNIVNVIKESDLNDLFNNLDIIIELMNPFLENPDDITNIDNLVSDSRLQTVIENPIVDASFANRLIIELKNNEMIKLPNHLSTPQGWIKSDGNGELRHIIDSINILNVKLSDIINGHIDGMDLMNEINDLNNQKIDTFFNSEVLRATVSGFITDSSNFKDFMVIVPNSSVNSEGSINKNELIDLIHVLKIIPSDSFSNGNIENLLTLVVKNKELILNNDIISTTIVYNIKDKFPSSLTVHKQLMDDATLESLKLYRRTNLWRDELPALINALDYVFMKDGVINIDLGLQDIKNNIVSKYADKINNTTYLDLLYDSHILSTSVSNSIDEFITPLVDEKVLPKCKDEFGAYDKNEILSLLDFAKFINVNKLDGIKFANIDFTSEESIKFINESIIGRAIISKEFDNLYAEGKLRKHNLAYDDYYNVLKADEIIAFSEILGQLDFDNFNIRNINLSNFKPYIYDKDGITHSYILTATASNYIIKNNPRIIIPKNSMFNDDTIKSEELVNLITSLEHITGHIDNLYINDINFGNIRLKSKIAKEIIKSDIINATIANNITLKQSGNLIKVLPINNGVMHHEMSGFNLDSNNLDRNGKRIAMFSESEFESLCFAIESIGTNVNGLDFDLDYHLLNKVLNDDVKLDKILNSSLVHIYINDILEKALQDHSYIRVSESDFDIVTVYDLKTFETVEKYKLYNVSFTKDILKKYNELLH